MLVFIFIYYMYLYIYILPAVPFPVAPTDLPKVTIYIPSRTNCRERDCVAPAQLFEMRLNCPFFFLVTCPFFFFFLNCPTCNTLCPRKSTKQSTTLAMAWSTKEKLVYSHCVHRIKCHITFTVMASSATAITVRRPQECFRVMTGFCSGRGK